MNKKNVFKILFIFLIVTMMSGCTVNYNLTISKKSINENAELYVDKSRINDTTNYNGETFKQAIDTEYKMYTRVNYNEPTYNPYAGDPQSGIEYYTKKLINTNERYGVKYSYDRELSNLANSNAINYCYKNMSVSSDGNINFINPGIIASCFETYSDLDELNITITLEDYIFVYSTANEIKGNNYIWHLNRDNYKTNLVRFKYAESDPYNKDTTNQNNPSGSNSGNGGNSGNNGSSSSNQEESETKKTNILIIILISIPVLLVLGYTAYKIKNKKNNKL